MVAGGWNGNYLKSVERYDVATNQWSVLPNMNISRRYLQILNERMIFAVGGRRDHDVERAKSTIEKYDADEQRWMIIEFPKQTRLTIYQSINVMMMN